MVWNSPTERVKDLHLQRSWETRMSFNMGRWSVRYWDPRTPSAWDNVTDLEKPTGKDLKIVLLLKNTTVGQYTQWSHICRTTINKRIPTSYISECHTWPDMVPHPYNLSIQGGWASTVQGVPLTGQSSHLARLSLTIQNIFKRPEK